jgi:hypothetical protein
VEAGIEQLLGERALASPDIEYPRAGRKVGSGVGEGELVCLELCLDAEAVVKPMTGAARVRRVALDHELEGGNCA